MVEYRDSLFFPHDRLSDPNLYKKWKYIANKDTRKELNDIHQTFLDDLKLLNKKYKWLLDIDRFSASCSH